MFNFLALFKNRGTTIKASSENPSIHVNAPEFCNMNKESKESTNMKSSNIKDTTNVVDVSKSTVDVYYTRILTDIDGVAIKDSNKKEENPVFTEYEWDDYEIQSLYNSDSLNLETNSGDSITTLIGPEPSIQEPIISKFCKTKQKTVDKEDSSHHQFPKVLSCPNNQFNVSRRGIKSNVLAYRVSLSSICCESE